MTLFDHYLEYMTQLMEGRRTPPEGITLPEGDMTEKVASLSRQLQQVGTAAFVRACARQDGVTLPEGIYPAGGRYHKPSAAAAKRRTAGPRTGGSPGGGALRDGPGSRCRQARLRGVSGLRGAG